MLYQAFSPYAGGGHTVELPFYAVTEINALKYGYGCDMLGTLLGESVHSHVGQWRMFVEMWFVCSVYGGWHLWQLR